MESSTKRPRARRGLRPTWPLAAGIAIATVLTTCQGVGRGDRPIVLPLIIPLTGDLAEFGAHELHAAELAVEALRDEGGIDGRPIELVVRDSAGDPERACAQFLELHAARPFDFCYVASSDVALAVAPLAEKRDVLLLSDAADPAVSERCRLAFRHCPDAGVETRTLVDFAVDRLGARSLALVHVDTGYGRSYVEPFRQQVATRGASVAGVVAFPAGDFDPPPDLEPVLDTPPHAVVFIGSGAGLAHAIEWSRAHGFVGHVLAAASVANPDARSAAPAALEGVLYADVWLDATAPHTRPLVEAHWQRFRSAPPPIVAMTYDAFALLFHAMRAVGPDSARVAHWLRTDEPRRGAAGDVRMHADRYLEFELRMLRLQQGRGRPFEDAAD